jgi:hypothetical protein
VELIIANPKNDPVIEADRKRTLPNCRDEVLIALEMLIAEHGDRPFPAREIYTRMLELGTTYAELTAYTAMQRMKLPDPRMPGVELARVGRQGFRLIKHIAS